MYKTLTVFPDTISSFLDVFVAKLLIFPWESCVTTHVHIARPQAVVLKRPMTATTVEGLHILGQLQPWVIFEPHLLDRMPSSHLWHGIRKGGEIWPSREKDLLLVFTGNRRGNCFVVLGFLVVGLNQGLVIYFGRFSSSFRSHCNTNQEYSNNMDHNYDIYILDWTWSIDCHLIGRDSRRE